MKPTIEEDICQPDPKIIVYIEVDEGTSILIQP